jgi:hypothetical protein
VATCGGYFTCGQAACDITACDCSCHGDWNCDGVVNVSDVVGAIGVAFRNQPSTCDPGCTPNGRAERTDVNCDGITSIVDVIRFVNVAFRNADQATEFCKPCDTPPPSAGCP